MDEILKQTLLYDFYGELLTDHQKEIYEQVVLEDYSLSQIAKDAGISRQGVHDMIKRCNKTLEGYEEKLHLVSKFIETKEKVHEIEQLSDEFIKIFSSIYVCANCSNVHCSTPETSKSGNTDFIYFKNTGLGPITKYWFCLIVFK